MFAAGGNGKKQKDRRSSATKIRTTSMLVEPPCFLIPFIFNQKPSMIYILLVKQILKIHRSSPQLFLIVSKKKATKKGRVAWHFALHHFFRRPGGDLLEAVEKSYAEKKQLPEAAVAVGSLWSFFFLLGGGWG